jgi:hypothetical protein
MATALNPVAVTVRFQPSLPLLGRIAPVGINIPAGVGRVHDGRKVLAVVGVGSVGDDSANELVPLVDVHRELVAEVALAMLLRSGGVNVLLSPLGRRPVRRHGAFLEHFMVVLREVLLRCRHQRGVDDLPSPGDEPLLEQLCADAIEDDLGTGLPNPVLEYPHCGPVWNVGRVRQSAEALVTHAAQQLAFHLFVRQVVQALQDQNAHHGFGGKRRPTTSWTGWTSTWRNAVNFRRQGGKVDRRFDLGKRIAQRVDLLPVMPLGKQVRLDGASS